MSQFSRQLSSQFSNQKKMNDPFFCALNEAQPVFASKNLEVSEIQISDQNRFRTYHDEESHQSRSREPTKSKYHSDYDSNLHQSRSFSYQDREDYRSQRSNNNYHHGQNTREYQRSNNHYPGLRMPSMLNGIKAPKPLKINPNKPPQSKKFFNLEIPDHYVYAKPYDGV